MLFVVLLSPFLVELVPEVSVAAFSIFYNTIMRVFIEEFLKSCQLRLEKLFLFAGFSCFFLNLYTSSVTEPSRQLPRSEGAEVNMCMILSYQSSSITLIFL